MGVDFNSFSRVKIEPVPQKYHATFGKREKRLSPLLKTLALSFYNYQDDDEIKLSEHVNEFYETIASEEDFIAVNWNENIMYKKTKETRVTGCGRSYGGYWSFCRQIEDLYTGPSFYMLPSTDVPPDYGVVSPDKCIACLDVLNNVKEHFVSKNFQPDVEKYGSCVNHRFHNEIVPIEDRIHEESWFFREFYTMLSVACDDGVATVF